MKSYELKNWELTGQLTTADQEYLQACSMKFDVGRNEDPVILHGPDGRQCRFAGRCIPATVWTQSVNQESALLLRYSDRLYLKSVTQVREGAIVTS